MGPGYDICWVQLPGKALGNAATSAEYVTYGIKKYAKQSKTGKVFVIGHSQGGGLSIPWVSSLYFDLSCVLLTMYFGTHSGS